MLQYYDKQIKIKCQLENAVIISICIDNPSAVKLKNTTKKKNASEAQNQNPDIQKNTGEARNENAINHRVTGKHDNQ